MIRYIVLIGNYIFRLFFFSMRIGLLAILWILIQACDKNPEATKLFNGTDLSGWDTYLGIPDPSQEVPLLNRNSSGIYTEAFGLNNDPMNIFSVVEEDGVPAIRISGYIWGGLITKEAYENYHFHLEYKWGTLQHPPREDLPKNSGLCYHSVGEYGAFWTYWMRSFELEIKNGSLGDFVRVDDVYADINATIDQPATSSWYHYDEEGTLIYVNEALYTVKASGDYENPIGNWNSVDLYVYKDEAMHVINNKVVLIAKNLRQRVDDTFEPILSGKIQLQSEGAEIYYRNLSIESINTLPL